jgi:DNA repair exonuclease SbcCD ATPase subunit
MILRSIKLKHFKKHQDLCLNFDEKLNLIGGPNEAGKSTVAEAIHAALFFKHTGKTKELNELQSLTSSDGPSVELKFEQAGISYTLSKTFLRGSNCTLISPGRNTLVGPAAEEELGRLLASTAPMESHSKAKGEWAHLWIWQGTAGSNPSLALASQQVKMLDQLQQMGLMVAMASKKDQEAASKFSKLVKDLYVNQGAKFKAGTTQVKAEGDLIESKNRLAAIQTTIASMESNVKKFEEDLSKLMSVQKNLVELTEEYEEIKKRLEELKVLEVRVGKEKELLNTLSAEEIELQKKIAEIKALQENIVELEKNAVPAKEELKALEHEIKELKQDVAKKKNLVQELESGAGRGRLQEDYWRTLLELQNKTVEIHSLDAKLETIKGIESTKAAFDKELAGLPLIRQHHLDTWTDLEADVTTKKSVLDAIATEVEVLNSGSQILISGNRIEGKVLLTNETILALNGQDLIKIVPGGGRGLEVASQEHNEANKVLEDFQRRIALKDKQKAIGIVLKRETLEKAIRRDESKLEALESPGTLKQNKSAAENQLAGLDQQKNGLLEIEPWLGELACQDISLTLQEVLEENTRLSSNLTTINEQIRRKEKELEVKGNLAKEKSREFQVANDQIMERRTRLTLLSEQAGDVDRLLEEQRQKITTQTEVYEGVKTALSSLDPDNLKLKDHRIREVLGRRSEEERSLTISLAELKGELKQSGGQDFYQEEQSEYARQEQLVSRFEGLKKEAEAIKLLDQLFARENEELTNSYAEPFAEKVKYYLSFVFGPEVTVSINSDTSGNFSGLEIYRGQYKDLGRLDFDKLSGGSKEQIAAAVRLAMAEVLAPAYGGYLPILFDDAFAYSDKERLKALPDMLYGASQKGIQVILLSCTPEDYAGLGAHEISLSA